MLDSALHFKEQHDQREDENERTVKAVPGKDRRYCIVSERKKKPPISIEHYNIGFVRDSHQRDNVTHHLIVNLSRSEKTAVIQIYLELDR